MSTDELAARSIKEPSDDFTVLSDLGKTSAEMLNVIGIHRFAELAKHSPEELRQTLASKVNYTRPAKSIQTWIEQARRKAEEQGQIVPHIDADIVRQSQLAGFFVFFDRVTDEKGERVWQTHVFQTRVYHDESGDEKVFDGVVPEPWVRWILDHAGLIEEARGTSGMIETRADISAEEVPITQTGSTNLSAPDVRPEVEINIVNLDIVEAEPLLNAKDKRLRANLSFQLLGAKADSIFVEGVPCQVEIFLNNIDINKLTSVANERRRLQPNENDFTYQTMFPMPEPGNYQLQVLILLLSPVNVMAMCDGAPFQVTTF